MDPQFAPAAAGARAATLSIASNDLAATPYLIHLTGTGLTYPEIVIEQPAGTPRASTGVIFGWGNNFGGALNTPGNLGSVQTFTAGALHTLAIRSDGSVAAWGYQADGAVFVPSDLGPAVAVSAGNAHSVALLADGTVRCWGSNADHQLEVPPGLSGVKAISAGSFFTVALKANGTVAYWGTSFPGVSNVPANLSGVQAVACGFFHTLALKNDGTVVAWGRNDQGECNVPAGLGGVKAVAAGSYFSVALKNDGTLTLWGVRDTDPLGLTNVVAIDTGDDHVVALLADGTVRAFGNNSDGQIDVPVGLSGVTAISAAYKQTLVQTGHTIAFGPQTAGTASAAKTFTIRNTGLGTLTLGPVRSVGRHAAEFTVDTAGMLTTVPPGGQTTCSVTFAPAGGGVRQAALSVLSNDVDEPDSIILLTGTGLAPQFVVEQPAGTVAIPEGTRDFGNVDDGQTATLTFTVRNTGAASLILGGSPKVSVSGPNAADFSVIAQPGSPVAIGADTTFQVRFSPQVHGPRSARLTVLSNDVDQSPYGLTVTGYGSGPLTHQEAWRQTYFGSPLNAGNGANEVDFDGDGLTNLAEYAFGLDPTQAGGSTLLPQLQRGGGNVFFSFAPPPGVAGVTYGAEWSTTLQAGSWTPIPDTGTPPQHLFSVPIGTAPKIFLRLKVSSP